MNLPQIQKIMMEFEKQNEMMGAPRRPFPSPSCAAWVGCSALGPVHTRLVGLH